VTVLARFAGKVTRQAKLLCLFACDNLHQFAPPKRAIKYQKFQSVMALVKNVITNAVTNSMPIVSLIMSPSHILMVYPDVRQPSLVPTQSSR
jgi:hypothetical protein